MSSPGLRRPSEWISERDVISEGGKQQQTPENSVRIWELTLGSTRKRQGITYREPESCLGIGTGQRQREDPHLLFLYSRCSRLQGPSCQFTLLPPFFTLSTFVVVAQARETKSRISRKPGCSARTTAADRHVCLLAPLFFCTPLSF